MNELPFCVFKRSNRPYYFVLFKDSSGRYINKPVSTKKKTEKEAKQVAFEWYRNGIPQKENVITVSDLSLREVARNIKTGNEAEIFLTEMQKQGLMKAFVLSETPQAQLFIDFLLGFWDWENSVYVKEKLRKNHGLHKPHCIKQRQAVTLFWEPFFNGRFLGEINAADIDAFITHMGEKDLSASRKNVVIKAGFKALRWAFSKGMIETDPTRGHILFSGDDTKRNILTPAMASAIFRLSWKNEAAKLGNMLAAVTGMRCGEILALQVKDFGTDCLYVKNSWNRMDKLKLTKTNEARTVEVPFPDLMKGLIEHAGKNPGGVTPDSFVFWSEVNENAPMHDGHFRKGLRSALEEIDLSETEAKKYLFHGWRHFYTSYMIGKLDKKLLKSQTGHKTDVMLAHYADHMIDGEREVIQSVAKKTFKDLLPERPKQLAFRKTTALIAANQ